MEASEPAPTDAPTAAPDVEGLLEAAVADTLPRVRAGAAARACAPTLRVLRRVLAFPAPLGAPAAPPHSPAPAEDAPPPPPPPLSAAGLQGSRVAVVADAAHAAHAAVVFGTHSCVFRAPLPPLPWTATHADGAEALACAPGGGASSVAVSPVLRLPGEVQSVAVSPAGEPLLGAVDEFGSVRVVRLRLAGGAGDDEVVLALPPRTRHPGWFGLAFRPPPAGGDTSSSSSAALVLAGTMEQRLSLYDVGGAGALRPVRSFGTPHRPSRVAYLPSVGGAAGTSGEPLVALVGSNHLSLWDVRCAGCVRQIRVPGGPLLALDTAGAHTVAVAGTSRDLFVYDVRRQGVLHAWTGCTKNESSVLVLSRRHAGVCFVSGTDSLLGAGDFRRGAWLARIVADARIIGAGLLPADAESDEREAVLAVTEAGTLYVLSADWVPRDPGVADP